jgi:fimbrial chaperone protein
MATLSQRVAVLPAALAVSLFPSVLEASEVVVSPVRLQINYGTNTTTLSLKSKSENKILFQLESFLWTQNQNADQLAPTKDILAMPPVFTIERGKTQVIRIIFRGPRSETQEITYRVILTEVPVDTPRIAGQIRTNLQISIPVFVKPKVLSKPQLEWSLHNVDKKNLRLVVKNSGNSHILLGTLKLFPAREQEKPIHETSLSGYVLPGQSRSWVLGLTRAVSNAEVFLRAETDNGKQEMPLIVQ